MLTPVSSRKWGLEFIFPLLCFLVSFNFFVIDDTVFIIERTCFQKNNKNVRRHIAGIASSALSYPALEAFTMTKSFGLCFQERGRLASQEAPHRWAGGGQRWFKFQSVLCQLCDLGQYSSPI